jgi:hypothetical protein
MNNPITPQSLLEQILPIRRMEHGSLSVIRQGPNGPYYNLNSWEQGPNHCRYTSRDKVSEVQQAIASYQKFQHSPSNTPKALWSKPAPTWASA